MSYLFYLSCRFPYFFQLDYSLQFTVFLQTPVPCLPVCLSSIFWLLSSDFYLLTSIFCLPLTDYSLQPSVSCLSACLPVWPPTYLPIYLPTYLSTYLSIYLPTYLEFTASCLPTCCLLVAYLLPTCCLLVSLHTDFDENRFHWLSTYLVPPMSMSYLLLPHCFPTLPPACLQITDYRLQPLAGSWLDGLLSPSLCLMLCPLSFGFMFMFCIYAYLTLPLTFTFRHSPPFAFISVIGNSWLPPPPPLIFIAYFVSLSEGENR